MARKTQISKEVILEAALKMLIRDGYSAINIKTLSKEIGCSTQPLYGTLITWRDSVRR